MFEEHNGGRARERQREREHGCELGMGMIGCRSMRTSKWMNKIKITGGRGGGQEAILGDVLDQREGMNSLGFGWINRLPA